MSAGATDGALPQVSLILSAIDGLSEGIPIPNESVLGFQNVYDKSGCTKTLQCSFQLSTPIYLVCPFANMFYADVLLYAVTFHTCGPQIDIAIDLMAFSCPRPGLPYTLHGISIFDDDNDTSSFEFSSTIVATFDADHHPDYAVDSRCSD